MLQLLAIIGLSAGISARVPPNECCLPGEWEAIEGFTMVSMKDGKGHTSKGVMKISYDRKNQRIAATEFDGRTPKIRVIQDYKNQNRVQYIMNLTDTTHMTCVKSSLGSWTKGCVPEDSRKIIDSFYGLKPASALNFIVYEVPVAQTPVYVTVTKDVVTNACIPISEQRTGPPGVMYMMSSAIWGLEMGISNSTVFDIPPECNNAVLVPPVHDTNFHQRKSILFP